MTDLVSSPIIKPSDQTQTTRRLHHRQQRNPAGRGRDFRSDPDQHLAAQAGEIIEQHKTAFTQAGRSYDLSKDIISVQKKHRYLRYDYIKQEFCHFPGREMCEKQTIADQMELDSFMEVFEEILYYYSDRSGGNFTATGRSELQQKWFPYSMVYHAPDRPLGAKEQAAAMLLNYLRENNWIGCEITPAHEAFIIQEINRIIDIFGKHELGFSKTPTALGPALKKFNLHCKSVSHHNRNKMISLPSLE